MLLLEVTENILGIFVVFEEALAVQFPIGSRVCIATR